MSLVPPGLIMSKESLTLDDVTVRFTRDEWQLLAPAQKALHRQVMLETYSHLVSIGEDALLSRTSPLLAANEFGVSVGIKLQSPDGSEENHCGQWHYPEARVGSSRVSERDVERKEGGAPLHVTEGGPRPRGVYRAASVSSSGVVVLGHQATCQGDHRVLERGQSEIRDQWHQLQGRQDTAHRPDRPLPFLGSPRPHPASAVVSQSPCQEAKEPEGLEGGMRAFPPQDHEQLCSERKFPGKERSIGPRSGQVRPAEKPHVCGECGKRFARRSFFLDHQVLHTGQKPHQCSLCAETFARKAQLVEHQRASHRGHKLFQCAACPRSYRYESGLLKHQKAHTAERPHACPDCGKRFAQRTNLTVHRRTHTGERPFACAQCGRAFTQKSELVVHERTHTGERPFACAQCGKAFIRKGPLRIHQRAHRGEKPYACGQCGKGFNQKTHLANHARTHTGERPYLCSVCGKGFGQQSCLLVHLRAHAGRGRFPCAQCGRCYAHKGTLVTHQKIHSAEKRFQCAQCPKAFETKRELKGHQRSHSAGRLYTCKECGQTFGYASNLYSHQRRHKRQRQAAGGLSEGGLAEGVPKAHCGPPRTSDHVQGISPVSSLTLQVPPATSQTPVSLVLVGQPLAPSEAPGENRDSGSQRHPVDPANVVVPLNVLNVAVPSGSNYVLFYVPQNP
ncbi:PREDICTED: zinc finger protein 630-like [Elephantulus edwardii]|uniref:zinc finger protein 630-like n=1 Tax=Elephantulus edwardii TaxID=28737 RepID=UPI0003F093FD|nr:PREDICTED: zinc finger protein 630-like [Elephantulus edwardii]